MVCCEFPIGVAALSSTFTAIAVVEDKPRTSLLCQDALCQIPEKSSRTDSSPLGLLKKSPESRKPAIVDMATALIASCRPWCAPTSFRHRHGPHQTAQAFRVKCSVESTSSDSTSTSGGEGNKKHVDTRIHWKNEADGWIGMEDGDENAAQSRSSGRRRTAGLLDQAPDSHYRFMGVSSDAEVEEIKSAYRRLSKLYHPDSTQLPLEIAGQKFMRLKDAYDTLSNQELRNLYDNRLADKVVSNTKGSMYGYPISSQQGYEVRTDKIPERVDVDTLGGRNMPLSGQATSALAFDLFVLSVCVGVILFVAFFKTHAST